MKPAALDDAADQLGGTADAVISVLGATPLGACASCSGDVPVLRMMPTVAVEIGSGRDLPRAARSRTTARSARELLELLGVLGHLVEVADAQMDAATAVMGCSPAYLARGRPGARRGRRRARGSTPSSPTSSSSRPSPAPLELLRRYDPIEVRRAVASPGGSTEAGLEALADAGVADGASRPRSRLAGADARMSVARGVTRGDIADYVARSVSST